MGKISESKIADLVKTRTKDFFNRFLDFIKNVIILFKESFKQVLAFILICSTVTAVVSNILKQILEVLIMKVSGNTYIAPVNLKDVFLHPVSLILCIVFAVIIMMFSLFEMAGLMHAFSMAQVGRSTNLASMFSAAVKTCRRAMHPKNWLIIVFVMILFPLTKVMPLSSSTIKLILPGFVNQTIDYTRSLFVIYHIIYFAIIILLAVYGLSISGFVLQNKSFNKSLAKSRELSLSHVFEIILTMALLTLILNFLINSLSSAIVINGKEFISFIQRRRGNVILKSGIVGTQTYVLRQILKGFLAPAVNNAALTTLYYRYIEEKGEFRELSGEMFKFKKSSPKLTAVIAAGFAAFIALVTFIAYTNFSYLQESVDRPLVCAHRGDNTNAPENTIQAFELAANENLTWIELDVHQTSDGVIVCNHDSTIKRTTGHNKAIHDTPYTELKNYEMGSWMPGDYNHVRMPTLEEALWLAKAYHMNVQVELKGHRDDVYFEENVLKAINNAGMRNNVMIIAQDAKRLQRIYELDPEITKGYCMVVAVGNLDDIEYTDNITIEETNVTPDLVRRMHAQGKKVFCWTVDLDDTVQYLVSCGVDVIGTDNPMLITNALEKADYSGGRRRFFHILMHMIANMDK